MSKYMNQKYQQLEPYTPGEQPQDRRYIKLNTNESPYPPSEGVMAVLNRAEAEQLRLYSDPEARLLKQQLAEQYQVGTENVFVANGSDEALNFAFMAFAEKQIAFADITYGFYEVFAQLHQLQAVIKPLQPDFSICVEDYLKLDMPCVIANPNAPTGLLLPLDAIERILQSNPDQVVIVDEAYIDFGGVSAVPLTKTYENLLVVQTYSKSRSLAGARLGYAIGSAALIHDLETIRFSTNPYNVNRLTLAMGVQALRDQTYFDENCRRIMETRAYTKQALEALGFQCLDSKTNFLFVTHASYDGAALYQALKERGILVRHFNAARICQYNRITIGTRAEMETLVETLKVLLLEEKRDA